jgi:hypothetical protein
MMEDCLQQLLTFTLCALFQLCTSLAEEFDTIRAEYWQYTSRTMASKYGKESTTEAS